MGGRILPASALPRPISSGTKTWDNIRKDSRHTIFQKFLGSLGGSRAPSPPPAKAAGPYAGPYAQSETNFIYQLLFCDDPELFRPRPGTQPAPWHRLLFDAQPDPAAVRALAEDQNQESRIRILACNWLLRNRQEVPKKELLGIVVEVPLDRGLDVLAAYADGRIRYINQTGRPVVFESAPANVSAQAGKLLAASRAAIAQIGPWDRPRLPPPKQGRIRLTFLVSDGLYFGEGPLPGMDRDPIAAPVISEAGKLLQMVVDVALKGGQ
jgi:hypothetical protein